MSDDASEFFVLPPFKAEEALVKLRRDLRELKALADKGTGEVVRFDWRGLPVIELGVQTGDQPALAVSLARKPSQRPDWVKRRLSSSAEARKFVEDVKRSIKQWDEED